jgi:hypothetical protein
MQVFPWRWLMRHVAAATIAAIVLAAGVADGKGGLSRAESRYEHERLAAAERAKASVPTPATPSPVAKVDVKQPR